MPYGTIKVDTITFTDAGVDKSVAISGLVQNPTFTGNVTATGTISGLIVQAPTVTGTTANFASGVYTTQISGAIVKVPAGSAGAPSIQVGVGASVAPGLYGAGTDILGISTGGAGRIFIDSTGRLGVGTSTPQNKLEVIGDGERMVCRNATNSGIARIEAQVQDYASGPSFIGTAIVQNGSTTAGTTAGLSNGNLGILQFQNTSAGLVTTNGAVPLVFATTSTERMRIDGSGNVGIGTSSQYSRLYVSGTQETDPLLAGAVGPVVSINGTNNADTPALRTVLSLIRAGKAGVSYGNQVNFNMGRYSQTGTAAQTQLTLRLTQGNQNDPEVDVLTLLSNGNVGIGTSNPDSRLHVVDAAGNSLRVGFTGNLNLYDAANHVFRNNGGTTDFVRIDSSGRVGIGTSTPQNKLEVIGDGERMVCRNATNSGIARIEAQVQDYASGPSFIGTAIVQNGSTTAGTTAGLSNGNLGILQFQNTSAGLVTTNGAVPLVFATTSTERMRIDNGGGVLHRATGASGATATFDIGNSNTSVAGDILTVSSFRNTTNSTYNFVTCVRQGFSIALYIRDSGNVENINNSYGAISDVKLKENIVDSNSQWNDLKALQVRNYNFKEGQTHTQIGLVAQEVELISPGLVSESPDRDEEGNDLGTVTKSVNYSVLYMKAVKALQEAMERIETLEAKVAALGGN
jgi:hypothetical protein